MNWLILKKGDSIMKKKTNKMFQVYFDDCLVYYKIDEDYLIQKNQLGIL
jgi:S-adenosylmethionine:diacylglycerol 3-amino-3-carboxypropyl transferase